MPTDDGTTTTERDAVLGVLTSLYGAWEANDADAFVVDYLDDATVVQPGIFKKDRHEIRSTMAAGFAGPLKGSTAFDRPVSVRFPVRGTAIVVGEGGILFPGHDAVAPERAVRATWVLVKVDGHWKVASYQNSPAN